MSEFKQFKIATHESSMDYQETSCERMLFHDPSAPSPSQAHPPVVSKDFLSILLFGFAFFSFAMNKVTTLVVWEHSEPNHDQSSNKFTEQSNASTNQRLWPKQMTHFPKGPVENIDSTCLTDGRCFGLLLLCCTSHCTCWCVPELSVVGLCHTH